MIERLAQTLTIPELRRLIAHLLMRLVPATGFVWHWSRWRRLHQIAAAIAHRKSRQNTQL